MSFGVSLSKTPVDPAPVPTWKWLRAQSPFCTYRGGLRGARRRLLGEGRRTHTGEHEREEEDDRSLLPHVLVVGTQGWRLEPGRIPPTLRVGSLASNARLLCMTHARFLGRIVIAGAVLLAAALALLVDRSWSKPSARNSGHSAAWLTADSSKIRHFEYVIGGGALHVYSIDHANRLVQTVSLDTCTFSTSTACPRRLHSRWRTSSSCMQSPERPTDKVVAYRPALGSTADFLEIDWRHGRPIATTNRYGVGYARRPQG